MLCRLPPTATMLQNQSAGGHANHRTKRLTKPADELAELTQGDEGPLPDSEQTEHQQQQQKLCRSMMAGRAPMLPSRRIISKASRMPAPGTPLASTATSRTTRCASAIGSAVTTAPRQRDDAVRQPDMRNHFDAKLLVLIGDTFDTCQRGNATPDEVMKVLVAPLMSNLCRLCQAGGAQ